MEDIKNIATTLAVIISALAFIKAVIEFSRNSKSDRANKYLGMRESFKKNHDIQLMEYLAEYLGSE